MKVALCQINPILGDFRYNQEKIQSFYHDAVSRGADLVVFPEMAVTGYPPQDLLLEGSFVAMNMETAQKICAASSHVPLILGYVRSDDSRLFNSAIVTKDGEKIGAYDKALLPTYDVFDEDRYFMPGKDFAPIVVPSPDGEVKLGLQICEDLWDQEYQCKVSDNMVGQGADLIINISASPFSEGKRFERMTLITEKVSRLKVSFLYCNMVGAQDELVFDGHSLAYDASGNLIAEGRQFEEQTLIVDTRNGEAVSPRPYDREEELFSGLVLGVGDYFRKTGHSRCVIGLSGGIDSALVACIAAEALGKEQVTCVSMPSGFSSQSGIEDSALVADNLGVELVTIRIDDLMAQYDGLLAEHFRGLETDITEENIQARIRGNLLMAFSNKLGYLVLSTGNKTELALGYCTLYGDMSGGLAVISDLSKTDVYAVARWYNRSRGAEVIPKGIFEKTPSAELSEGQVDPFDYDVVSPLVDEIVESRCSKAELLSMGYDKDLVERIYGLVRRAEFKRRQAAPGIRVTSKAFGMGRRYPIVNHFDGQ